MKKSFMTRVLASGLSLAMAFSMAAATNVTTASAASKPKMIQYDGSSAKNLSVKLGESVKIKVNAATQAKYKVSAVKVSSSKLKATKNKAGTVVKITGAKATEEGKPASVKVSFQVKTTKKASKYAYVSKVSVIDDKQAVTAAATGAKKVTVSFNKALATTSGVAISVKKGATVLTQNTVTFSDSKTAVVELKQSLTSGSYTAEITGLEEGTMTAEFTVDSEEYIKTIELLGTKAPMVSVNAPKNLEATVTYTMKNQYEEVISASTNIPNFTISTAVTPDRSAYKNGQGTITIKKAGGGSPFVPGEKVYINATLTQGTHVATMSGEVEIALPAQFDKAEFKGIYNKTLKKLDNIQAAKLTGTDKYSYYLLFTAKDQYDVAMDSNAVAKDGGFTAVSTNPAFITPDNSSSLETFDVDDVTYVGLPLTKGSLPEKGGKAEMQLISSSTGTKSVFEIVADAAGALDTLKIGTPSEYVVVGEVVEIPFEAKDQYGNTVTAYSALAGSKTTLTDGMGSNSSLLYFDKQTDGTAKLLLDLSGKGNASIGGLPSATQDATLYLSSVVNANGSFSSTTVNVKAKAYPASVVGLNKDSSVKTTIDKNAKNIKIKYSDLDIADQYGRTMASKKVKENLDGSATGKYKIYAIDATKGTGVIKMSTTADSGAAAVTAAVITNDSDEIYLHANADGNEKVTFGITSAGSAMANNLDVVPDTARISSSEKEIKFTTSGESEYVSFEVKDIDTMYYLVSDASLDADQFSANSDKYESGVTVYGVKADGSKVALPHKAGLSGQICWDGSVNKGNLTVSSGAISQTAYNASKMLASGDFQVSKTDATYADVTATLNVTILNAKGSVIGTATKDFKLSNKAPKVAKVEFNDLDYINGDKVTLSKASAEAIATTVTTSMIKKVSDQYGKTYKTSAYSDTEVKVTIGKLTETGVTDGFTVVDNGKNNTTMSDVEPGDTFKVTISYNSGYSKTFSVIVK